MHLGAIRDFQSGAEGRSEHWTDGEIDETAFKDARLGRRFADLIRQIGDGMGESIPYACQDWANTKAAYRFFANDRVEEAEILKGHFASTRDRFSASRGPILLIQDTTEFTYQREASGSIGMMRWMAPFHGIDVPKGVRDDTDEGATHERD